MQERTYLKGLLQGKCPQCRQGLIFRHSGTNLRHFSSMNPRCPHCGVRLEPEPGFYQGAMYVSYAITLTLLFFISGTLYLLGNPAPSVYTGVIITVTILVAPWNFRYSRIIYLYLFGGLKHQPGI
jgi:uncharacterized protein (DUF983 family)